MTQKSPSADIRAALTDISPMIAGAIPFAMVFGSIAAQKGLSPLEAVLMSATVYAGAAQFIAVDIWSNPVPVLTIVLTTLLVNLRHVLMGAALVPHLEPLRPWQRYYFVSIHTDESWAVALKRAQTKGLSPTYIMAMTLPFYVQWPLATLVGAVIGNQVGDPARFGFDFVFTAVFIALVTGFWKAQRQTAVIAVSVIAALITREFIPGVWYIFIGGVAGTVTGALLWKPSVDDAGEAT